jgi:DNA-binding response OmpR family regulator
LRRVGPATTLPKPERFGDVEVDPATHSVRRRGAPVALAPKEFDLLLALLGRQGAVASRLELRREVWGYPDSITSRTVDTHVAELRRKLEENPSTPRHILTVRKTGYRLQR